MATTRTKRKSNSEATPLTADDMVQRLRDWFRPPGYGFLTNVGNGTGARNYRWCDGLAMSLWPSRGLDLIGFEIKVSRYDWTKELRDPAKADEIFKYCNRWYLAVSEADIVANGELPATWGLIVADGKGIRIEKEAPAVEPVTLDRAFMCAVFRRAAEQTVDKKLLNAAHAKGAEQAREYAESKFQRERDDHDRLKKSVEEFEKASGISLQHAWDGGTKLGAVVYKVMHGHHKTVRGEAEWLKEIAASVIEHVDNILADEAAVDDAVREVASA